MGLNLNLLLIGLLHIHDLFNGGADVNVLAVLHEGMRLKLSVSKHVFDVELQLVCHVHKILVNLTNAIFEIGNVLVNSFVQSGLVKLLNEVLAYSLYDARLVHDRAQRVLHLVGKV